MKILVIGSGGREHAIAWRLSRDACGPDIFCAPGNAGTAGIAENLDITASDIDSLSAWAVRNRPDLVVVGPEAPLCAGLADRLARENIRVFGPNKAAAQMEGSKLFAKAVMQEGGVPTAGAVSFSGPAEAVSHFQSASWPLVIKAEGLAEGKGVFICGSERDAVKAVDKIMVARVFGESGRRILVEEYLEGEEASILALVDGSHVVLLATSQDHKRAFNNDEGPNTGGMGAYSPAPVVAESMLDAIREQVFGRTLAALQKRGIVYKGILYAGLIITPAGPKVLEFNCRMGDPETQAILPRIEGDLTPALTACVDGTLHDNMLSWRPEPCVCVVMASGGYPDSYARGKPIEGIAEAEKMKDVIVFHAGTRMEDGRVVTAGGRVLGITALGGNISEAIRSAYLAISKITFDQAQYRTDIGRRALKRLGF